MLWMYLLQVCQEEINMADIVYLLNKELDIGQELIGIVIVNQVHVDPVSPHCCHGL